MKSLKIQDLKQDLEVFWDIADNGVPFGSGLVKGIATAEMPVVGCLVIVETKEQIPEYPFSSIVMPLSALRIGEAHENT